MKAGGSNIKATHAEDTFLCGLFPMNVTKTVDSGGTSHTTTDATNDIGKLLSHEDKVTVFL
jgi:hypothetical protein